MQLIKVQFLKDTKPTGKAYTYFSPVPVNPGDTVQINSAAKGIVVEVDVPEEEIAAYRDKVKCIVGLVEESKNRERIMTAKKLAALLNGREYGSEITKAEEDAAKKSGLVVVFGQSDDLMEFRGAIDGEVDCYEGGTAYIDGNSLFNEGSIYEECTECKILEERKEACCTIFARWCKGDFPWSYHTEIPHETFEIFEGSERYCQGIVFSVDALRVPEKYCPEEKEGLFNLLRGVVVSSYLPHDDKNELIDFVNYLEGGSGDE